MKKSQAFSLIELSIVILIIGILIAGVTQGSRLVSRMKLNNARTLTQSSDVASIKDLVLWLDATKEGVFTNDADITDVENNNPIKSWRSDNPQSPTVLSFTQGTAGRMPTYLEDGINNLPTLFFDANTAGNTGKSLSIASTSDLNNNQLTTFIVTKPLESTTDTGTIIMNRGTAFDGYNLYKNSANTNFELWIGNGTTFDGALDTLTFNTTNILTMVCSSTSNSQWLYKNGNAGVSRTTVFSPQKTSQPYMIGSNIANALFYDGHISEIIIYARALKTEERKSVEKYLAKKYAVKLP